MSIQSILLHLQKNRKSNLLDRARNIEGDKFPTAVRAVVINLGQRGQWRQMHPCQGTTPSKDASGQASVVGVGLGKGPPHRAD
mmetsp:Transcript_6690/g.17211  ORF Transcript_6690/g.17211 Transcript_6690/m.17211 type:complete len:83 (-) Transcript_6690:370-618(-)